MNYPSDVAVDAEWNVYVVETNNNRIQKFAPHYLPLGVYANAAGTSLQLCAETNIPKSFYLYGLVPSFTPPGLTGAEFRIEVENSTGYLFNYTPPNGASAYGSPFDLTPSDPNDVTGASVFFIACQPASPQPGELVDFGRVDVLNLAGGVTTLRIRAKQPPANPAMPCPRFFLCNEPLYTPQCMSPTIAADIVYEVELNPQSCTPEVFAAESLPLDTHEVGDDGAAGPVSTDHVLTKETWFLITVRGTVSLTNSASWASPPNVVCGIPEVLPQTASLRVENYWVGADAEVNFSAALGPGSDCALLPYYGYPRHHERFEIDLGSGFSHIEPLGGAPSDPGPSHQYRFLVQGQGARATFHWVENPTSDNYGVISIHVEEVTPTDVARAAPGTPATSRLLMLPSAPDPFNPTAKIRYVLPREAQVTVEVYDVKGRMVRRLFGGRQGSGYQSITWDGRVETGLHAPSGAYFARVTTPEGSATERMTLVK